MKMISLSYHRFVWFRVLGMAAAEKPSEWLVIVKRARATDSRALYCPE
jgi:hypothetical protein